MAIHKFKCLNPNCQGTGRRDDTGLFLAHNNDMPSCPCCGSLKIEDWGPCHGRPGPYLSSPASHGRGGVAKQIDGTLQGLADHFGLTDINNRDGQPAKQHKAAPAQGKYGNMNIMGVDVPINDSPTTVTGSTPYTPVSVQTGGRFQGSKAIPTQILASDKG